MQKNAYARTYLLGLIVVMLLAVIGYFMRPVLLPVLLAFFFAMLVRPLYDRLKKLMPAALAMVVVTLLVGAILLAIPVTFAANIQDIVDHFPEYKPRLEAILDWVHATAKDTLDVDLATINWNVEGLTDWLFDLLTDSVKGAASFFGTLALTVFHNDFCA